MAQSQDNAAAKMKTVSQLDAFVSLDICNRNFQCDVRQSGLQEMVKTLQVDAIMNIPNPDVDAATLKHGLRIVHDPRRLINLHRILVQSCRMECANWGDLGGNVCGRAIQKMIYLL